MNTERYSIKRSENIMKECMMKGLDLMVEECIEEDYELFMTPNHHSTEQQAEDILSMCMALKEHIREFVWDKTKREYKLEKNEEEQND